MASSTSSTTISRARAATTRRSRRGMLMGMAQPAARQRHAAVQGDAQPRPADGQERLSAAAGQRRDRERRDRLIDRQHPHDFFMELSASVSQNIGPKSSVFLYAGLPGEPAFGPPAFMHREAIMDSPEAPISHHWLDSTHISFGVVTAGVVLDRVKLEVSRFNGREPDQHRWNIETGPLDSTAVRLSWNPTRTLALQGSWGHFIDPEQLEPGRRPETLVGERALRSRDRARMEARGNARVGPQDRPRSQTTTPYVARGVAEACRLDSVRARRDDGESRAAPIVEDGPAYRVGKVSLGAVRDFKHRRPFLDRRRRPVRGQFRARRARAALRRATIRPGQWVSSG